MIRIIGTKDNANRCTLIQLVLLIAIMLLTDTLPAQDKTRTEGNEPDPAHARHRPVQSATYETLSC